MIKLARPAAGVGQNAKMKKDERSLPYEGLLSSTS